MMSRRACLALPLSLMLLATPAFPSERVAHGDFAISSWSRVWWSDGLVIGVVDGMLCSLVRGGTRNAWDKSIGQNDITLVKGTEYTLTFRARGTPGGQVRGILQLGQEPWSEYASISLEANSEQVFATKFVSPTTTGEAQLAFQLGGSEADWTFCVDDISIADQASSLNDEPAAGASQSDDPPQMASSAGLPRGTAFRGIALGDSRERIEAVLRELGAICLPNFPPDRCAIDARFAPYQSVTPNIISFDEDGRARFLHFTDWFFEAGSLSGRAFAEAIVANYPIPEGLQPTGEGWVGKSDKGELIRVLFIEGKIGKYLVVEWIPGPGRPGAKFD